MNNRPVYQRWRHWRPYFPSAGGCRNIAEPRLSGASIDRRGQPAERRVVTNRDKRHCRGIAVSTRHIKRALAVAKLALGAVASPYHLLIRRPALIIGFGGYPSFAPLLAGRLLGIPILLHEQNAFLGWANHMLAKFANALALSWPQTKNLPAMSIVELTGIPVRQAFFDAAQTPYRLAATTRYISPCLAAARRLDLASLVPDAIAMLDAPLRQRLHIHQQARSAEQIDDLQQRYIDLEVTADIQSFYTDVPSLLAKAIW